MTYMVQLSKLFLWNSKLKLQRGFEYRADFFIGSLISLFMSSLPPLFQYLIFSQTNGYPGWTIKQIILFQGILLIWIGLRDTAFGEMKQYVLAMIRRGEFDRLLLKPYPPIILLLTSGFNIKSIGAIFAGFILSTYSCIQLEIIIAPMMIPLILLCLFTGLLLHLSLEIIFCILVVRFVQIGQAERLFDTLMNFANYPVELFTKIPRLLLSFAVPFALWIYYPTQVLLNRVDLKLLIAFVSSIIIFIICNILWNRTLKRYTSAGG